MNFKLVSPFTPTGDQPAAIEKLVSNLNAGVMRQTLLGVTGSGKTFTMANVIARVGKPTLVISHNKTLAAQLYQEFKDFFPENAVHYFVSYYDYYQPEAYLPASDTYIEKDAKINEAIDALRHASTASLLTRNDVIIVASVSCIYGIGEPETYESAAIHLNLGDRMTQKEFTKRLTLLQYARNPIDPRQGHWRRRENVIEVCLPSGEEIVAVEINRGRITSIESRSQKNYNSRSVPHNSWRLFPAKHFVTEPRKLELALKNIETELKTRVQELKKSGKILEAARLSERTKFDIETLRVTGYVNGIENYSRHLSFRSAGSPPATLIDYFRYRYAPGSLTSPGGPASKNLDFLTIIDESHATIPQIRGMFNGDRARKQTLVDYGFRLPSALDNRPLTFDEFNQKIGQTIYVSATPAAYELELSGKSDSPHMSISGIWTSKNFIVEQLIRPTGILDPKIEIRKTAGQMRDVIREIKKRVQKKERALVLALTKRLAEDIADYLAEAGLKAEYLHSEIKTLDRPEKLKKLREGKHDVLVGINLLREGLDLPEVSFIAILDADKEGFLRNERTLLQIIGRAARHIHGHVVLYADTVTDSMKRAIAETNRRRTIQADYNRRHGITPREIKKEIRESMLAKNPEQDFEIPAGVRGDIVRSLEREMKRAAKEMNFELAAMIRDKISRYRNQRPR